MSIASAHFVGTFGPRSAAEMLRLLADPASALANVIEFRLDLVPDAGAHLEQLIAAAPRPVLATCRRPADGGGWTGREDERMALLRRAAACGAAWVDVEADADVGGLPDCVRVVRSLHVERVHGHPSAVADRLLANGHVAKLIARDGDESDVLRLLAAVRAHSGRLVAHVVAHPFSRVASAAVGAPFVYAALRPGGRLGLVLPTVAELLDAADLRRVRAGTPLFVLVGGAVDASVSPQMLNAAFAALGSPVVSARWSCDDPLPLLHALPGLGWSGLAVTIPHKSVVHDHLRDSGAALDDAARAAQAVNTVVVQDGAAVGRNTDAGGLLDALAPHLGALGLAGCEVLVVGAGGAARAAVSACAAAGARVTVFARRPDAARALLPLGACAAVATRAEAGAVVADVVIDATPAGPPGGTPVLDLEVLPRPAVVLDMLVASEDTALLAAARAHGHRPVPGFDMLVHQAARQVELVTGHAVAPAILAAAGRRWLTHRGRRVVLLGLRCSGKTTVGRLLAAALARPFVDTDDLVTQRLGRTPGELLAAGAEASFRAAEAEALVAAGGVPGAVVATGGGAALSPAALSALSADALVVLLDARDDEFLARWRAAPRVALTDLSPAAELARQRAERLPTYERLASRRLDTTGLDSSEIAETLAGWLATPQSPLPSHVDA